MRDTLTIRDCQGSQGNGFVYIQSQHQKNPTTKTRSGRSSIRTHSGYNIPHSLL